MTNVQENLPEIKKFNLNVKKSAKFKIFSIEIFVKFINLWYFVYMVGCFCVGCESFSKPELKMKNLRPLAGLKFFSYN